MCTRLPRQAILMGKNLFNFKFDWQKVHLDFEGALQSSGSARVLKQIKKTLKDIWQELKFAYTLYIGQEVFTFRFKHYICFVRGVSSIM